MLKESRAQKLPLGLLSLYYITVAANQVEAFRLRLENEKPVRYDEIYPGCTILYDNETFGFAYFNYYKDKARFIAEGKRVIEHQKNNKTFVPKASDNGLIHCSIIPWISFTSFSHATSSDGDPSIPKIVIGKIYNKDGDSWMPVSVEVHHALVDGLQVGKYFEALEELCK
jgi:chloramphenicol O-acetyltransferase type A